MKRGLYFLVAMFMMVSSVEATNVSKLTNRNWVNYSYDNAVNFFERGVEFFVFTNGDFDFDTSYLNRGIRIDRNFRGQIRRIGNVFINYDFRGNVTRIGNVFLNYRRNRLVRVGNLEVRYDRWGYPIFYGDVRDNFYFDNGIRFDINIGRIYNFNDRFFYRNNFNRNYTRFREDRNFYYYKANRGTNVGKNDRIIRRRKSAVDNRRNNNNNRNNRFTYRKSDTNNNSRGNATTRNNDSRKPNKDVKRRVNKNENRNDVIRRGNNTKNLNKDFKRRTNKENSRGKKVERKRRG